MFSGQLPSTTSPWSFTSSRSFTRICLKFMPSGLTQKWSSSSGSRAVMWPAVPSSKPKCPEEPERGGEPLLAVPALVLDVVNFGNRCGLRSLAMAPAYLRLYRSVQ